MRAHASFLHVQLYAGMRSKLGLADVAMYGFLSADQREQLRTRTRARAKLAAEEGRASEGFIYGCQPAPPGRGLVVDHEQQAEVIRRIYMPGDAKGLDTLARRISSLPIAFVVLEATGGFKASVAAALAAAGLPLCIVKPRRIRDFAGAMGRLAKTNTPDTEVITLFAERIRPPVKLLPEPKRSHFAELLSRRRQIIGVIGMEANRRDQAVDKQLIRRLDRHIAFLEWELDRAIGQAIKASPGWCETEALLKSVPGIGDVTARTLLAQLPELGTLNSAPLAANRPRPPHRDAPGPEQGWP